jgi:hypothetical protein
LGPTNPLTSSDVTGNLMIAGSGGAGGAGGAGKTKGGQGGQGGAGGTVYGGGITMQSGAAQISDSHIDHNLATAGNAGAGGKGGKASAGTGGNGGAGGKAAKALGGGVYDNSGSGTFTFSNSSAAHNTLTGGKAGAGGAAGSGQTAGTTGAGGVVGTSEGGGIYVTGLSTTIDGSKIVRNAVKGARGDKGGGGGLFVAHSSSVTIQDKSYISNNSATGTQGGGGILLGTLVTLHISQSDVDYNQASAGKGGGLAVAQNDTVTLDTVTLDFNKALAGGGIFFASGGGGSVTLTTCVVCANMATTGPGPDLNGAFLTGGHNIIGVSGGFTGITDGTNNDQVGTPSKPIKPPVIPPSFK